MSSAEAIQVVHQMMEAREQEEARTAALASQVATKKYDPKPYVMLFSAFTVLVFLDLFSKFIALSAGWLIETGKFVKPSLFESVRGIAQAHRDRIINSHAMRTQFAEKLIVYLVLVFAGCFADRLIGHTSMAQLAMAYLAGVEFLSIVENLDDAGVSAVHDLAGLIKRKRV